MPCRERWKGRSSAVRVIKSGDMRCLIAMGDSAGAGGGGGGGGGGGVRVRAGVMVRVRVRVRTFV